MKTVFLALSFMAVINGALAQSNSSVVGWWYAARNQWQLHVVEMRPDGTATLGECVRTHPYDQACAGSASIKMTATYALRGNEMDYLRGWPSNGQNIRCQPA